jgi:DNA repair exonuclease SbcCD ATPase subunit
MFSYGENNYVDFSKLEGIVGMFAANASGKSSMLDALSFCLFDTSSRAFKAINVMNNKKDWFECKVGLTINGIEYGISRTAKKSKNDKVKLDVDFWMIDDANERISLNGDSRYPTNANIRRVIGSYEDFILTSMQLQNNFSVFLDKGQRERKEVLAQFMGIGVFDQLYTLGSEQISEVKVMLKDFKKRDYSAELVTVEKLKVNLEQEHKKLTSDKNKLDAEIETYQDDILNLHKQLKTVDSSIVDIDKLDAAGIDLDDRRKKVLDDIESSKVVITSLQEKTTKIEEIIKTFETDDISGRYEELGGYERDKSKTQTEIDALKIEVRHKLDKVDKLGNLQYDPNCKFCMTNPFTLDAIETKKSIETDKGKASLLMSKLKQQDELLSNQSGVSSDKEKYDKAISVLSELGHQLTHAESNVKIYNERKKFILKSIFENTDKIAQYHLKKNDIIQNEKINGEIDTKQNQLDEFKLEFVELVDQTQTKFSEIRVFDSKLEQILSDIENVKDLEEKFEAYEFYLDAVKRDGVPYELIKKSLPTIEGAVNEILAQMVDFNIIIHMDGKNINTYIVYDEDNMWPLELSSGMERFVASLAIRVGLINVCNLPRNNALFLDEGMGNLDADNLNTMYMMFEYLKMQFPFIVLVSHLETMRDVADEQLEICKKGDYSYINYQ